MIGKNKARAFRLMELALERAVAFEQIPAAAGKIESCSHHVEGQCFFQNALEYMVLSLES